MATMYTVIGGTLLNLGVTFTSQGSQMFANGSFIGAGEFFRTIFRFDEFELHLFLLPKLTLSFCMQVFSWLSWLGPCKEWKNLINLRKWFKPLYIPFSPTIFFFWLHFHFFILFYFFVGERGGEMWPLAIFRNHFYYVVQA